jgi:hypothetical protein
VFKHSLAVRLIWRQRKAERRIREALELTVLGVAINRNRFARALVATKKYTAEATAHDAVLRRAAQEVIDEFCNRFLSDSGATSTGRQTNRGGACYGGGHDPASHDADAETFPARSARSR